MTLSLSGSGEFGEGFMIKSPLVSLIKRGKPGGEILRAKRLMPRGWRVGIDNTGMRGSGER